MSRGRISGIGPTIWSTSTYRLGYGTLCESVLCQIIGTPTERNMIKNSKNNNRSYKLLYVANHEEDFPPFVLQIGQKYYFIDMSVLYIDVKGVDEAYVPCGLLICEASNLDSLKLIDVPSAKKLYKNDEWLNSHFFRRIQKYTNDIVKFICDPLAKTKHGTWYLELSPKGIYKKGLPKKIIYDYDYENEYGTFIYWWVRRDQYLLCTILETSDRSVKLSKDRSKLPIVYMNI
jgi:hypothetical protein